MAEFTVCVTDKRHESYDLEREILQQAGARLEVCRCETEEDILRECSQADGILLDQAPMTRRVIMGLAHCKVINRYGAGYDNVDLEACRERGIQVTYVPDYCMEDVSDHALALMLACLRHIPERDRKVRQGQWDIPGDSFRLRGKTLGLIGAGRIARVLARKVQGFAFAQILAYDPFVPEDILAREGIRKTDLDTLLNQSDFISLHLHLTPETRNILDGAAIRKMKPSAILINVSRGGLVDDDALLAALRERRILAAGLDTHSREPLGSDSPFCALDNAVLTDHTAYYTREGVEELKIKSAKNVVCVLKGLPPPYPLVSLQ